MYLLLYEENKRMYFFRLPIFMGHWLKGEVIMIYEILMKSDASIKTGKMADMKIVLTKGFQ